VALRRALITDQPAAGAGAVAAIIGGGGALVASRAWAQMMADALNRPLHITAEEEITARGVAILILRALGLCALDDYPPAIAWTLHPRPAAATALRAARERQADLYRRLIGDGE
jgi:gluconokinase